ALNLPAALLLAQGRDGRGVEGLREQLPSSRELPQRGAHEEMKGEHGGDGIAGEAEEMRATDAARGEGTPRLHRHLPEVDAARLLEYRLDEIVVAPPHAAAREGH